jgi:N-acetylmuramic acid 6-phosphate etherase
MEKITEQSSIYEQLENKSIAEIISNINAEDQKVALAVNAVLPSVERLIEAVYPKLQLGGRLFYIGAGTSGRLGVVDASEIPPTFGVAHGIVIGIIAGGDTAIRKAVEFAEDDTTQAWKDLQEYQITNNDCLIGIAASGSTPYVAGGLSAARQAGITTGAIVCNTGSAVANAAEFPIEVLVGPEYVTGSTRMKSGTAQKMILNMISTACMIRMGRVKGNKMVDMQLSNNKLIHRGAKMLMDELNIDEKLANELIALHGNVRKAMEAFTSK